MNHRSMGLVAALVVSAGASAVTIDDFSQGTYLMSASSSPTRMEAVRNGATSAIFGGQRDAMIEYTSGPLGVSSEVGTGVLFFNTDSQSSGKLYLQYDGSGDGELETDLVQTAGTGLNLNLAGSNAFLFDFRFVNGGLSAPLSVAITVTASNGSFTHTSNIASGMNVLHNVGFGNFGAANFADIRRLDFVLTAPASADYTLDMISTQVVPEPATLGMLGLGVVALLRRKRS